MGLKFIEQLKELSLENANAFVHSYVSNEDNIVKEIREFPGIKAELYCQNITSVIDTTKFLSIYSDLTSVSVSRLNQKANLHLNNLLIGQDNITDFFLGMKFRGQVSE